MAYDLKTTCPAAHWSRAPHDHLSFGAAGLEPCAVIDDGDGQPYAWAYRVHCVIVEKAFSSRCDSRGACLDEACHWLRHVNRPGQIDRPAQADAPSGA